MLFLLIMMVIIIGGFTLVYDILRTDFGKNEEDGLTATERLYIRTFRTSIGDILTPIYGPRKEVLHNDHEQLSKLTIWLFWTLEIFLIFVILQNFLVNLIT